MNKCNMIRGLQVGFRLRLDCRYFIFPSGVADGVVTAVTHKVPHDRHFVLYWRSVSSLPLYPENRLMLSPLMNPEETGNTYLFQIEPVQLQ